MKSGGLGVGSVSIVLIFAVLCLTVFSLITFYIAGNDKALVDAKADAAISYYKADALAESILAEILSSRETPENIKGTAIYSEFDDSMMENVYFITPISDISALYVNIIRKDDAFDILSWKMIFPDEWSRDDSINIWQGTTN